MKRLISISILVMVLTSCNFRSDNFDGELSEEKLVNAALEK